MADCIRITLTNGRTTLVSAVDAGVADLCSWKESRDGYAEASRRGPRTALHRLIMEAPEGVEVDHINGDKLDNRRENLRLCTKSQNLMNRGPLEDSTSAYKGVTLHKQTGRWQAQIGAGGERHYLGLFNSEAEAARAYDEAAKSLHGRFAKTNVDLGLLCATDQEAA